MSEEHGRSLTKEEATLLRDIKLFGEHVRELCDRVQATSVASLQYGEDLATTPLPSHDPRWLAIARTQLQQGFMALRRSIEKPFTF